MAEVTTASPIPAGPISAIQAAATAEESKIVAFIKAHYSKLVSAGIGYAISKLGLIGLLGRIF